MNAMSQLQSHPAPTDAQKTLFADNLSNKNLPKIGSMPGTMPLESLQSDLAQALESALRYALPYQAHIDLITSALNNSVDCTHNLEALFKQLSPEDPNYFKQLADMLYRTAWNNTAKTNPQFTLKLLRLAQRPLSKKLNELDCRKLADLAQAIAVLDPQLHVSESLWNSICNLANRYADAWARNELRLLSPQQALRISQAIIALGKSYALCETNLSKLSRTYEKSLKYRRPPDQNIFEVSVQNAFELSGEAFHPQRYVGGFHVDGAVEAAFGNVLVECDGPCHFLAGGEPRYRGSDVFRNLLLSAYTPFLIRIPYTHWHAMRSTPKRVRFISQHMAEFAAWAKRYNKQQRAMSA